MECEELDLGLAMVKENQELLLILPGDLAKVATAHWPTLEVAALPLSLESLVYRAIWPQALKLPTAMWLGQRLGELG